MAGRVGRVVAPIAPEAAAAYETKAESGVGPAVSPRGNAASTMDHCCCVAQSDTCADGRQRLDERRHGQDRHRHRAVLQPSPITAFALTGGDLGGAIEHGSASLLIAALFVHPSEVFKPLQKFPLLSFTDSGHDVMRSSKRSDISYSSNR